MDNLLALQRDHSHQPGVALQLPALAELVPEARECFQQGMVKLQQAQPEAAVTLLLRTVELAPSFPEARICLGLAYALSHEIYPAIDNLELAGRLDPESFAAHYTLAKLNFKLRIPQKGYEAARLALECVSTMEQRKMLTELLKEERARERNGIRRPTWDKPFGWATKIFLGGGLAVALIALLLRAPW
jgi:tetratricopeptide (TPR) repeat protein